MRHTGPTLDKIPELAIVATTSTDAGYGAGIGAPMLCADMRGKALWLDGKGAGTVTGAVQPQGTVGGDEWIDIGSPISTWPSFTLLSSNRTTELPFTAVRLKTSTNFSAGTPRALLCGDLG